MQLLKPQVRELLLSTEALGGMLHIHENVHENEYASFLQELPGELESLGRAKGKKFVCQIVHVEKVKSYAPKVNHYVFDVQCTSL